MTVFNKKKSTLHFKKSLRVLNSKNQKQFLHLKTQTFFIPNFKSSTFDYLRGFLTQKYETFLIKNFCVNFFDDVTKLRGVLSSARAFKTGVFLDKIVFGNFFWVKWQKSAPPGPFVTPGMGACIVGKGRITCQASYYLRILFKDLR